MPINILSYDYKVDNIITLLSVIEKSSKDILDIKYPWSSVITRLVILWFSMDLNSESIKSWLSLIRKHSIERQDLFVKYFYKEPSYEEFKKTLLSDDHTMVDFFIDIHIWSSWDVLFPEPEIKIMKTK